MTSCFIRGSVIRYIHLTKADINEDLLLSISFYFWNSIVPSCLRCTNRSRHYDKRKIVFLFVWSNIKLSFRTQIVMERFFLFLAREFLLLEWNLDDRSESFIQRRFFEILIESFNNVFWCFSSRISKSKRSKSDQMVHYVARAIEH